MTVIRALLMSPQHTLRDAMVRLNETAKGIVLVVDEGDRLLSTVTDGDLRRAMLDGVDQAAMLETWMEARRRAGAPPPTAAPIGTETVELLRLMQGGFRHIPLLDGDGRVVDLARLEDLVAETEPLMSAVVMAGGLGARLRPLTLEVPKPMLHVGDRPVIEHVVMGLRDAGIGQVRITTHYRADVIQNHFGNGERFGVAIDYVNEDLPSGTAGALALMAPWTGTLLVVNGDVLSSINYRSMLAFHRDNNAVLTVAVRQYEFQVPYGIVNTSGVYVRELNEKPTLKFFVNAGIYMLEPAVQRHVAGGTRFDMTDLIAQLLDAGEQVASYPISEYWLDIGQPHDYERAQEDARSGKLVR